MRVGPIIAAAVTLLACTPSTTPPPSVNASSGSSHAVPVASVEPPSDSSDASPEATESFRACGGDADCIAVSRAGCCHNGWKEAVAANFATAYEKSVTCPQANPICPMYIVIDSRVPECNERTRTCVMIRPADVACGGTGPNPHACPSGTRCKRPDSTDQPGSCVK